MKTLKKIIISLVCIIMVFALASCAAENDTENVVADSPAADHVQVTVKVKDFGTFVLELYPEYAPETVANFVKLAKSGFYEGTKFHRVVENFMAQGGEAVNGEELEPIKGEFLSNGFAQNTLKHERGTISMARTTDKDSATSQFFICYTECPSLDGDYAAFGKVINGMDTIDSFLSVERVSNGFDSSPAVPVEDIVIESMTVNYSE